MYSGTVRAQRQCGFTLIELMITVTIVAILAAIALPSYLEQTRKTRRADAQTAIMENAQALGRHHTRVGCYQRSTDCSDTSDPDFAIPITKSPMQGTDVYYNLSVSYADINSFTITATPQNAQAADKCGNLALTNTGVQTCSLIADANDCLETCWR